MADAVTVGALTATVMSMALKAGLTEAVKDAYKALKNKVVEWIGPGDVERLEKNPASEQRPRSIAEEINQLNDEQKAALLFLAKQLGVVLESSSSAEPIGVRVEELRAVNVQLENLNVSAGRGVDIGLIDATGDFTLKGLTVQGKAPQ